MDKNIFREKVYNSQYKRLVESINESLAGEIKEIYHNYISDLSSTIADNLITISFTISGAGTSFEEVEGDMDNIADAYGMIVSDFSSFCSLLMVIAIFLFLSASILVLSTLFVSA